MARSATPQRGDIEHRLPLVHYFPDDRVVSADASESILQISRRAGIPHTCVCGGNARCSTCRVLIIAGVERCAPRNAKELAIAERLRFILSLSLSHLQTP